MRRGENLLKYDHSGPTYKTRPTEYRVWSGMKVRCTNPNFKDWHGSKSSARRAADHTDR